MSKGAHPAYSCHRTDLTPRGMADLNDTLVKASVKIDDGCDWTAYLIWQSKANYRLRNGIFEPAPERPKVAPVKIEPKKKPRKRGYRRVQKAAGAV